jgi:hypothetical protein
MIGDMRRIAAAGELGAAASYTARLDGARRRYLFVFARELGPQPAENLRAAFEALGAPCTLEVVGLVQSPRDFANTAKVALAAGQQAKEQRG